jgi:hypothetical protein
MKEWFDKRNLNSRVANSSFHYLCALAFLICGCVCQAVPGQQSKKNTDQSPAEDATRANEHQVIARLFGVVNDLKSESDKSSAALLLSEIADVLWRMDEPAARSMFRLAFDTAQQSTTNNLSALNEAEKEERLRQARRQAAAIKTILKRYGSHDRRSAEAWLQEFQDDVKSEQTKSNFQISPEQAEFLAEIAVSLVPQKPEEAQRLGLLSLSAQKIPSAYGHLLMALRDRNKTLSDVLFRQAFVSLRRSGFNYDSALVALTNYAFSSQGQPFPDVSPADVALVIQYFIDAASAQAARWQGGGTGKSDEQNFVASLYNFLNYRALPIVALNAPDRVTLLQSHVGALAQVLTVDQRLQAEAFGAIAQQNRSLDGGDSDLESRIQRAEREKNAMTRDFLFRNLAIQLMRTDPKQALSIAAKIDDQQMRAQTEDEVLLVLLQKAFAGRAYDEARSWALKFNDRNSQARWLTRVASRVASTSRDQTASDLLSQAYSIASKSDNTAARLDVLLLIAKEFVGIDQERGFEILSDALSTANKIEKTAPKIDKSSIPVMRVISVTMVDGQEVVGNERATLESIDFNQIGAFVDRDLVRTSLLGDNLKDRLLRTKYLIAVARSVLRVPRQGSGYERSIEDILSN